jgi:hypothetical protein
MLPSRQWYRVDARLPLEIHVGLVTRHPGIVSGRDLVKLATLDRPDRSVPPKSERRSSSQDPSCWGIAERLDARYGHWTSYVVARMGEPAVHVASAQRRRHRLFPALTLTLRDTLEQATATATQGGSLAVALSNNGLAIAFRPYVEIVLLTFQVDAANPLYVWDFTDDGTGFWRRPRRGERVPPDRRLAEGIPVPIPEGDPGTARQRYRIEGPGSYPEAFISSQAAVTRLLRQGTNSLAPMQTEELSLPIPQLPPPPEGSELTSWCVALRCFELLTDPAPAVALPTPAQPAHHRQLICLHTGT